ncbi:hypothetical protein [Shinella sp. NM-101]|uniref:hypothetical protein n=1 Tax=Shinella sp. NM-101 TaxID=2744455 RepID=UPI001F169518|nr:hypothetical protein [Shinella sp. NM-101]
MHGTVSGAMHILEWVSAGLVVFVPDPSARLSPQMNSIVAMKRNAALIIKTFKECVSPIGLPPCVYGPILRPKKAGWKGVLLLHCNIRAAPDGYSQR